MKDFTDYLCAPGFSKMRQGAKILLEGLAEVFPSIDLRNENFTKTPYRIAKAYLEMCYGCGAKEDVKSILDTSFPAQYDGMVIIDNISAYSLCPHHFLPVAYRIDFGYIPKKRALGLSKIPRFISVLARQPILQEDLTKEIIKLFTKYVSPKGCIVVLHGVHNCIQCRGANQNNAACVTSEISGVFKEASTRSEFFEALKIQSMRS